MNVRVDTDAKWAKPLLVWAKSEYLDSENYFRFGAVYPEYEGASWPFGIPLHRDAASDADPRVDIIDSAFDWHLRNAWKLPLQYSRLRIETAPRRSMANFTIRNIGQWDGDPRRYHDVISILTSRKANYVDGMIVERYALTPFGLIVQHSIEDHQQFPATIDDAYVVFFYTFETFIQECLALDAHRSGRAREEIIGAYEHLYSHSLLAPDALPRDPARTKLAKLATPSLRWDRIRDRAQTAARDNRLQLFELRLQAHLMVSIAVACSGLHAFERAPSPLVQLCPGAPSSDELAAFWLRHVLGSYDYAAGCEQLLAGLATRYGTKLVPGLRGAATPCYAQPRTTAESHVASAAASPLISQDHPEAYDRRRWAALFEASLDDASISRWRAKQLQLG